MVEEDVAALIVGKDEAVALVLVEELDRALVEGCHCAWLVGALAEAVGKQVVDVDVPNPALIGGYTTIRFRNGSWTRRQSSA